MPNTLRQLAAAGAFRIGKFKPTLPILILASTKDRMVNVKCSRTIAKAWKAEIIEHPTAGHDLSADDPEWIVTKLKDFA
jgi:predicted alpha/beta hydrolase family esterase